MTVSDIIKKGRNAGIKRGDLALVALLLALSLFLMIFALAGAHQGAAVRVCVDGRQVAVLPLDTDTRYEIPGGCGNVLEITGGKAHMLSAECPDGSCVSQRAVFRAGECIVCLPGRVTVTVESDDTDGLDAVAY